MLECSCHSEWCVGNAVLLLILLLDFLQVVLFVLFVVVRANKFFLYLVQANTLQLQENVKCITSCAANATVSLTQMDLNESATD